MKISIGIVVVTMSLLASEWAKTEEPEVREIDALLAGYDFAGVVEGVEKEKGRSWKTKLIHLMKGDFRPGIVDERFKGARSIEGDRYLVAMSEDWASMGLVRKDAKGKSFATFRDIEGRLFTVRLPIIDKAKP